MDFLETPRFPDDIAYGSRGGPVYNTSIFAGASGREKRNANWIFPKHSWDVAYGARGQERIYNLLTYFHSMQGSAFGFRFKDFGDYKSCAVNNVPTMLDQPVGALNGSNLEFQLVKQYVTGSFFRNRIIQKPVNVEDNILVSTSGTLREEGTFYELDYTTGILTFNTPQDVNSIRWGGEFDVPVRFERDNLDVAYDDFEHGNATVNVMEIVVEPELIELPGEGSNEMTDYPMIKVILEDGDTLVIPTNFQMLVVGSFTVEDPLGLTVDGELIILDP